MSRLKFEACIWTFSVCTYVSYTLWHYKDWSWWYWPLMAASVAMSAVAYAALAGLRSGFNQLKEAEAMKQQQPQPKMFAKATKGAKARKTYQPINTKLVIQVLQASNETDSGIVLPDTTRDKFVTTRAIVIAVGPECKSGVKEEDVILIGLSQVPELIRHRGYETLVIDEVQMFGIEIPEGQNGEAADGPRPV